MQTVSREIRMETGRSWFDALGGSIIDGQCKQHPYRLRVLLAGPRITPRHPTFEYFIEMGAGLIPFILKHEELPIEGGAKLLFVLPERHMSVHEQRMFLHRLGTHPQASEIKRVDVVTQNPLIFGNVPVGCAATFGIEKDDPAAGLLCDEMR